MKTNSKISDTKTKKIEKNNFSTIEVSILILLTTIVGLTMGFLIASNKKLINKETILPEELQDFINTYNYIKDNYYKPIDGKKLLDTGIEAMINSLDKYSTYYTKSDFENMSLKLTGEYEGIGVEIISDKEGNIYVFNVFPNSPAEKSGLKVGDIIKNIDGINVKDKELSFVSDYMKYGENKDFNIIVIRDEQELSLNLTRGKVILETVASKIYNRNDKKIGYIYVSLFAANTYKQFHNELVKLENDNIDSLIIDLRSNGGGHLVSLEQMISEFLDSSNLIFKMKQKEEIIEYYSKGETTKKYPIAILVDQNTASASEVMAISLKQKYGATIIGNKTYGKGTVQELNDNSVNNLGYSFKITTMQWLAPDDTSIEGEGITPDIEVSLDQQYLENPIDENDTQLQKALEYIENK